MGHRDSVGTPHMFENDHDQSRNVHGEQTYGHIARGTTGENGSFFYTVENGCPEGAQFTSHWNSAPRSNGFIPIGHNDQLQPCQPDPPGPTQESFMLRSSMGTFGSVPENYFPQASSSSYDRQAPYAVEGGGFAEIAMGSGRAHQKRKSPGIPSVCERGNTSRYYSGGPSSEVPAFSDLRQDLLAVGAPRMPWDHLAANNPGYRGNSLSVRAEGSLRNARSRAGICLEANSLWSHIPDSPPLSSFIPSQPVEHSSLLDIPGPSSNALTTDWSHVNISSAQGRVLLPDPHGFSHESTHFLGGSNPSIALPDTREYDFMTSRNPVVPQLHHHGSSNQSVRGPCNSYSHRSTPAFRPLNSTRLGTANPLEEGIRPVTENFSRHPRLPSATGWRNNDRNRRSRIATERYRSVPNEAAVHDRMGYEGLSVVDRSALYASRSAIDQHRDLRLDIDNMSYEELLALGERIGAVSTGLSGDSISKCLKETAYCPRDQMEDTERCAICLEAYEEADGVGTLKTCGHHYHAHCIRKWLSMKNSCPICKACALADDVKDSP